MFTIHFNPFPEFNTPRFLLRPPALSDAEEVAQLRSDPLVNKYLNRPGPVSVAAAEQFLEKIIANNTAHLSLYWVIIAKDTLELVGTICLWNIVPALEEAEVGYELQSRFFGQGIMQEVLPGIIRFGFEEMQLQRIIALPAEGNERSSRLLEKHHFALNEELKQRLEKEEDMTGILCYSLTKSV
ncbi:GNAT family N-acetyltransferase [Chitinophaga sp. 22321]|uniref:GNAT family N-acetyltransferase n=1 Tax=Chitinophaga hostae TaxID=2831022 RepID=A0ABS5ITT0_9BACT|nr:GNAT family N-acetyltransferase [Chitinophaga hostae]MBS0026310.1 GNAT family N-acetyltransferase [Chitinophaga hostae]